MVKANNQFGELLKTYAVKYPATIKQPFNDLATNGLKVVTSNDGLLRIYSWETKIYDSVKRYSHLLQYKGTDKTEAYLLAMVEFSEYTNGEFYNNIYDFIANGTTYYLTIYKTNTSKTGVIQALQVMNISNNRLNDHVDIIKTEERYTSVLITGYDTKFINAARPAPSIIYDAYTKTISVPAFNSKWEITEKFNTYKFTGQYFEKVVNLAK